MIYAASNLNCRPPTMGMSICKERLAFCPNPLPHLSLHTPKDIKVCMVYLQSYACLPMVETLIKWTVESSVEKLLEEKCRAELSARIASGEFTVEQSG
nr:hypothetical protein CFP56_42358 [Quercus suber]